MRPKYLYVRILEACNAGCFMCEFAHSKDVYRFSTADWATLIPEARAENVKYVRFTGGEPLLHRDIVDLVRMSTTAGFLTSLITNGFLLTKRIDQLVDAGLSLVVVSIDGQDALSHDSFRKAPGLFAAATSGIALAKSRGIMVRVNTVVGPHNYRQIPSLKRVLTDLKVDQWELSTLKGQERLIYEDEADVLRVGMEVFDSTKGLVPQGVPWFGADEQQRRAYFDQGVAPGPLGRHCNVVQDVLYLDPKHKHTFTCSCLSHRDSVVGIGKAKAHLVLDDEDIRTQRDWYYEHGPRRCIGCSTTASFYSNLVDSQASDLPDWSI